MSEKSKGPLAGIAVVEFAGIGPGPFCAMLLADMGADVTRIDRPGGETFSRQPADRNPLYRGRRSIELDLKNEDDREIAMRLVERADVLTEGYRPGVMEKLGLGPEECFSRNPRLVYGRMTGFGQTGPLSQSAGHDIGYIALSGALHAIGRGGEAPVPPLNLVGDFGGGALYLAFGILAALVERNISGLGQTIDAAMIDGAASLMTSFYGGVANGVWTDERGVNALDGGAPFYDSYETSDGGFIAVGAIEPKFFAELARTIGLDPAWVEQRANPATWPELRAEMARLFLRRTRAEWVARLEGGESCSVGVYSLREAPDHPHNIAREGFIEIGDILQPAPAPRFSRSKASKPSPPPRFGQHTEEILAELNIGKANMTKGS